MELEHRRQRIEDLSKPLLGTGTIFRYKLGDGCGSNRKRFTLVYADDLFDPCGFYGKS